ncbi:MAG: DUF4256 domain-containing protein [Aquaticitalea sp.]
MTKKASKELSTAEQREQLELLKLRFEKHKKRHKDLTWAQVEAKLKANTQKLWSLRQMEITGGEPELISYNKKTDEYIFFDCSPESPKDRRSLCYDRKAWESRKANKPKGSAMELAAEMGVELLSKEHYQELQTFGSFDTKTSSWLKTPSNIRELGGAIFGDFRFDTVFIYHNGVESYYAGRGFRGVLTV